MSALSRKFIEDSFACLLDEEKCVAILASLRWPDSQITCPHCQSLKVSHFSSYQTYYNRFKCKNCQKTFNEKTGTIFADSKLPLTYWFYAIALLRNKSSDLNLAGELQIDKDTARRMGNLIRGSIFLQRVPKLLSGEVEVDEVYITAGCKGNSSNKPKVRPPRKRGLKKRGVARMIQINHQQ